MKSKKVFKFIISELVVSFAVIGGCFLFLSKNDKNEIKKDKNTIYVNNMNELFTINNIMPNWKNDGKTYIDSGNNVATNILENENFDDQEFIMMHPNYYGVMNPFKIQVVNKNNSNVLFNISLTNVKNSFLNEETEAFDQTNNDLGYLKNNSNNLMFTIYENNINNSSIIFSSVFPKSNDSLTSGKINIPKGKFTYYIIIEYKQAEYNQNNDLNINLSGKISVEGNNKINIVNIK